MMKPLKRFLAALLSGTILAQIGAHAGEPVPAPAEDVHDTLSRLTQQQLELSGYKYTTQQAMMRASNTLSGNFYYPGRNQGATLSNLFATGVQADYSSNQVPAGAMDLWQDLQTLRNTNTLTGKALTDFAAQANIFYHHAAMSNVAATWSRDSGSVQIGENKVPHHNILCEIHETIHAVQTHNNIVREDPSWVIRDYQASMLSYEAAAQVGEFVTALDFRYHGHTNLWLQAFSEHPSAAVDTFDAYKRALAKDQTHRQALVTAGSAGFTALFKNQAWLNSYNTSVLDRFIKRLAAEMLTAPGNNTYSVDDARKTGWLTPEFNFTAEVQTLPAYEERFGNNSAMRQAFNYVSLEHVASTLGRRNTSYLKLLEGLEKQRNPFLGVDLRKIALLRGSPEMQSYDVLKLMKLYAGVIEKDEFIGVPSSHKINLRP